MSSGLGRRRNRNLIILAPAALVAAGLLTIVSFGMPGEQAGCGGTTMSVHVLPNGDEAILRAIAISEPAYFDRRELSIQEAPRSLWISRKVQMPTSTGTAAQAPGGTVSKLLRELGGLTKGVVAGSMPNVTGLEGEATAFITPDGLGLYFVSDRDGSVQI